MTRPLIAALALTLALSACGTVRDSRFNPFNWFGTSRSEPATLGPTTQFIDNRALVAQVTSLAIERTSTGAIVRAEGLTPTQGWWDAELVPQTSLRPIDGVVVYEFRIASPVRTTRTSTPQSRSVSVATTLSQAELDEVREIVVIGAQNQRRVRR
ncbi:hypothetical protein [Pararhodobacter sp. SW119]|uniref:hypothetical protein n=1 Tax=Pararhodobacter sp. SW119 TaxID=2780075 RepID=UPI001AE01DEC|nr:hypothetical protein [Pararhodobacter sp. SW119]